MRKNNDTEILKKNEEGIRCAHTTTQGITTAKIFAQAVYDVSEEIMYSRKDLPLGTTLFCNRLYLTIMEYTGIEVANTMSGNRYTSIRDTSPANGLLLITPIATVNHKKTHFISPPTYSKYQTLVTSLEKHEHLNREGGRDD